MQRIAYLSWPASEISGGIKLAFRHVEVLKEAGLEAVVATSDALRPRWFESTAPLVNMSELSRRDDILVFPENHAGMLKSFASWPNRKLVFCQNQFMVYRGLEGRMDYRDYGVSAILCEGRHVAEFCRRRFPGLPMGVVPVVIDHRLFRFQSQKRLQIAFAPRKRALEAACIRDLFLGENPDLRSIPWIEVSGVSEEKVAEILRDSAVYLSLCRFEAVPMTILEALACGCVTAGFTGFGAREYTTDKNGFWAVEDDCMDCATQLARAVRLVTAGGPMHSDMLEAAHNTAGYYNRERFIRRIIEFWQRFMAGQEAPPPPGDAQSKIEDREVGLT